MFIYIIVGLYITHRLVKFVTYRVRVHSGKKGYEWAMEQMHSGAMTSRDIEGLVQLNVRLGKESSFHKGMYHAVMVYRKEVMHQD